MCCQKHYLDGLEVEKSPRPPHVLRAETEDAEGYAW
jgi:hypothetical protein